MPRVSAEHEQEVRERIVNAADPRLHRARIRRHDPGRRARQRPVGGRDLHLLQEQGRAVPRVLRRDDQRQPRDARPHDRRQGDRRRAARSRHALLHRLDRQGARGRPRARDAGPGVGRRRRRAAHPRDARPASRALRRRGPGAAARGRRPRRAPGLARRRRDRAWLHLAARRAAPAAPRGGRALSPGRSRAAGARDPRPGSCSSPRTGPRAEPQRRGSIPRWATSRRSSGESTHPSSASRCRTSTPRLPCGTSSRAGTTGS